MSAPDHEFATDFELIRTSVQPESFLNGDPQPLWQRLGGISIYSCVKADTLPSAFTKELFETVKPAIVAIRSIVGAATLDYREMGYDDPRGLGSLAHSTLRTLTPKNRITGDIRNVTATLSQPEVFPPATLTALFPSSKTKKYVPHTLFPILVQGELQDDVKLACGLSLFAHYEDGKPAIITGRAAPIAASANSAEVSVKTAAHMAWIREMLVRNQPPIQGMGSSRRQQR